MGLHRRLIAGSAALFIGALGFLTSAPVSAAVPSSCLVNSTGDELNANTAVGCNSTAGTVTLRSALELFNANPGANSVLFNLPSPSVITLANGELPVNDAGTITITGPGARNLAIDGNAVGRVFEINPEGSVTANISGVTIRNGNAGRGPGGGVDIGRHATVTLDKVTITGNVAYSGGGIGHDGESLTVTNSTLSNNSITDSGNGCYAGAAMDTRGAAVTTFVNDTVTGNISSDSCDLGGTINTCDTATFTNVTISGNSGPGGALFFFHTCNPTTLKNSILANQTGSAVCVGTITAITDGGSNLDSDNSCGFTTTGPTFDLINTDPMLAGLANNGGPTNTLALKSGSPAIDAVKNTCPDPSTDQRGLSRPQGSACDIGAFEFSALKVTSVTASCGPVAGGGSVTITGSGFLGATSVKFGGVAAQSFTVVSDTQINAVAPAGQSGQQVDITVTIPAGTSTTGSPDQCTYQVLAVTLPKAGEVSAPTGGSPMGPLVAMAVALLVAAALVSIREFRLPAE